MWLNGLVCFVRVLLRKTVFQLLLLFFFFSFFFFFNYFLFSDKAVNQKEIGRIQLMRCLTRLTNLKENETQFIPRGSHIKQTGILTGNFELTTFLKEANLGVAQAFCNLLKIPKKIKI